ncbi:MAG: hypothetical protein LBQ14_02525 [Treponema sp.]|jgi:hypothetical protein|nr:hypothetical protein [Treponema sp.]
MPADAGSSVDGVCFLFSAARRPVALVDFCAARGAKPPVIGAASDLKVRRNLQGKNRLICDFLGFYAQSATNSWA